MEFNILWHVSFVPVESFVPRVPKDRAPNENKTVPRISFSEDINYAISSMPNGGQALRGMLKAKSRITPILHLYSCLVWENPHIHFVRPEDVQEIYSVPDAKSCREWWALEIPDMTHCIVRVKKADFEDSIDPAGNSGVLVSNIKYDIVKTLPKKAPEIALDAPIVRELGLRKVFASYDNMSKRSITR